MVVHPATALCTVSRSACLGLIVIWSYPGQNSKDMQVRITKCEGQKLGEKVSCVLSRQRVSASRCKCAVRGAHAKLPEKLQQSLGKAAATPHAGKSHVGSPLSSA